ncbi:maltotransferase domain-containing protein [Chloroflexota bacterium]
MSDIIDKEQLDGRKRVIIEKINPEIDGGRFPVKRIIGDELVVEADIFTDGHEIISALLLYRKENDANWSETPMEPLVNDRWRGCFTLNEVGRFRYTVIAWINKFQTWQQNLLKKVVAGQAVSVDFLEGVSLIEEAARHAKGIDTKTLLERAASLSSEDKSASMKARIASGKRLATLMYEHAERRFAVTYPQELIVIVDREKARFSAWYEMFPRSCASRPGEHGTFRDCEKMLPYIADMGFDVLYFPPIHPVGTTDRKGKNNSTEAGPDEPGTPWAIGSAEGGYKAIHPELGTLDDFRRLISNAGEYNIEIALDIAFQCSPDHPYVKEHPEWFHRRPDGTIQYAENPPKKYQDIYPLEFESEQWPSLWEELGDVIRFWIDQGVRIFRVDNPHTKPFSFWEWLIGNIKEEYPEVIFLAEAFTRPKVMYRLAKLGFSQSYTYFTWRNNKWELTEYMTELTQTGVKEFFRPNFWPNTPDMLSDYLRDGGRPGFMARLVLAATLSSNYGIYGPAFELCEDKRKDQESEEYLNSEKYELKHWDIKSPKSLKSFIATVNATRKSNPALQDTLNLCFHPTNNDNLICYSKKTPDGSNVVVTVVNLDCTVKQSGLVDLGLDELGLDKTEHYQVYDLLTDISYKWQGSRNYVELDPKKIPAHIFRIDQGTTIRAATKL